jgi:DHA1 family bicyclomycin/chloramphenicol resistance-like MFS transporter
MMGAAIGVWLATAISHEAMTALGLVLMLATLLAFVLYTMRARAA